MLLFQSYLPAIEERIVASGETLEGNCVYQHQSLTRIPQLEDKQKNLWEAAVILHKTHGTNMKLCEIGFNAGHSVLLFLLAAPTASYQLFDLGEHAYTRPCLELLQTSFPTARIQMDFGNSLTKLPMWIAAHKDQIETFDLVHVDGGHSMECIVNDMAFAMQLTKCGGIIIVDDLQDENIVRIVTMWVDAGLVKPIPQRILNVYPHVLLQKI